MKNNLLTITLVLVLGATLVLGALGPGLGWTVHVPATTVTLVSPRPANGVIYAIRQMTVINLNSGAVCWYSSNPSMNSNGVALVVNATLTIDQDDNQPYYFWSTNAFDVAGNGWTRQ